MRLRAADMTVVAVVGLGYVGLPLAVEFGKKYRTIGFDLSQAKIEAYRRHVDPTGEVSEDGFKAGRLFEPSNDPASLKEADFIIVAVPTPVDEAHKPDFSPLVGASEAIGRTISTFRDSPITVSLTTLISTCGRM